ncbi:hypothetical protein [Streptomyces sp. A1-5]|uniref:hypothetical protein n=1 Tax=Streptomyces sp. A1-5 TaxID=2738410 RepID=UPI001F2DC9BC|nr:hypothetical protein [Streptomyces sp. A1-5]UJB45873.1 hypothetical protein HRD51_38460 [Streptomyces sp. A1-5]
MAETVGVALAGLGVFVTIGRLEPWPHQGLQLLALAAGAGLFPLRRRCPTAVLLALAMLAGLSPGVGPITAATAYTVARRTARARREALTNVHRYATAARSARPPDHRGADPRLRAGGGVC